MIAGFTGTQQGMTDGQVESLRLELIRLGVTRLDHGDCIGGDKQANDVARSLGIQTAGHPPTNPRKRAYCECDIWFEPEAYLERNHAIVDVCAHLFVGPRSNSEQQRSGTWATYRYAKACGRPITIIKR